jgi:hypothetical protein
MVSELFGGVKDFGISTTGKDDREMECILLNISRRLVPDISKNH